MSDLQTRIARAIQHPREVSAEAVQHVTGSARLTPSQQVEIYREQFWLRHVGSLREDFPTIEHLIGKEKFEELCRAYMAAHPPDHFRLRDLSSKMETFLATSSYEELLVDCARIEWALLEAFDAADAPPLNPDVIGSIAEDDWPRARIEFHPSVRIFSCAHAVKAFREDVRNGKTPERPSREESFYVTFRRNEKLYVEAIERAPFVLLAALARGENLGSACEISARHDAETESKLGGWFERWVTLGWIANVKVS